MIEHNGEVRSLQLISTIKKFTKTSELIITFSYVCFQSSC